MSDEVQLSTLLSRWSSAVQDIQLPRPPVYEGPDVILNGFVEHSSLAEPGKCFVARVRSGSDGHPYIGQAVARNASLIIGQRDPAALDVDFGKTPYLKVPDSAQTEAWLAAAYYNFPGRSLKIAAITGTDGKTTTANLLQAILSAGGLPVGMLSTIKASLGGQEEPLALHVTTPEAPIVQYYLRRMVDAGLTHCVIEATSHGLAQHRLDAIPFTTATMTNITHEHLDYHGSSEAYFQAKASLFRRLATEQWPVSGLSNRLERCAVLNRDVASFQRLSAISPSRQIHYALDGAADFRATDLKFGPQETTFTMLGPHPLLIRSALVGRFNVYNMLAAAATAYALGSGYEAIRSGLESVSTIPGRMQRIDGGQPFTVIVDFAHTPNALHKALEAGRAMTSGRLIVVFGSAGKRDRAKRGWMAAISARLADLTVLTAEDPRTESLAEILEEMAEGCLKEGGIEGQTFWRVEDRGQAIYFALTLARPGDLILICGKGHEQSMCFDTTEYPWDDVEATRTAIQARLAGRPMPDLGLPTFDAKT